MRDDIRNLVSEIHTTSGKICLVVTGAGTQALYWLFAEPGASRTVLDAQVPYSSAALNKFTGRRADQHVSAEEARLMAERALERARSLSADGDDILLAGVSCTAAIATDRVRRGENRCHVAFASSDGRGAVWSLVLTKGERDRGDEEELTSRIVLNAIAEAKQVEERVDIALTGEEKIVRTEFNPGTAE